MGWPGLNLFQNRKSTVATGSLSRFGWDGTRGFQEAAFGQHCLRRTENRAQPGPKRPVEMLLISAGCCSAWLRLTLSKEGEHLTTGTSNMDSAVSGTFWKLLICTLTAINPFLRPSAKFRRI